MERLPSPSRSLWVIQNRLRGGHVHPFFIHQSTVYHQDITCTGKVRVHHELAPIHRILQHTLILGFQRLICKYRAQIHGLGGIQGYGRHTHCRNDRVIAGKNSSLQLFIECAGFVLVFYRDGDVFARVLFLLLGIEFICQHLDTSAHGGGGGVRYPQGDCDRRLILCCKLLPGLIRIHAILVFLPFDLGGCLRLRGTARRRRRGFRPRGRRAATGNSAERYEDTKCEGDQFFEHIHCHSLLISICESQSFPFLFPTIAVLILPLAKIYINRIGAN